MSQSLTVRVRMSSRGAFEVIAAEWRLAEPARLRRMSRGASLLSWYQSERQPWNPSHCAKVFSH